MTTCLWFWIDLNEELRELSSRKALPFVLKAWRWALSGYSCLYASLTCNSLNCFNQIESAQCPLWREAPSGRNQVIKSTFNFLFGASWTETLSAFVGYLGLIIYIVGLIQWIIIRFPKKGRIAGDF